MEFSDYLNQLQTSAIHAGQSPDPVTGAMLTPIYQTTTYAQSAPGVHRGYTYSRSGNPTVSALEHKLGALEEALPAVCFATGLAATTALSLALLSSGDHAVLSEVVYGGTTRLFRQVLSRFGVSADFVDAGVPARLKVALRPGSRLLFVETPGNPTLKLVDIAAAAKAAHSAGALLAVDNTLLTPALQRPFEFGADIILHSTTKYIDGHNATVGGALLTRDPALREKFDFIRNAIGAIQTPFNAWLTLQGAKTLPLRMARHSASALEVAGYLEKHPRVSRLLYPGLPSFPQYELALRQQKGAGGLIAFELEGGVEAGRRLMERVRLCTLAENLGATETLITHPATMTHAAVPIEQREATGITDGLVRLSVGLESPADIIADLKQALDE